jgi:hypothetical protein
MYYPATMIFNINVAAIFDINIVFIDIVDKKNY